MAESLKRGGQVSVAASSSENTAPSGDSGGGSDAEPSRPRGGAVTTGRHGNGTRPADKKKARSETRNNRRREVRGMQSRRAGKGLRKEAGGEESDRLGPRRPQCQVQRVRDGRRPFPPLPHQQQRWWKVVGLRTRLLRSRLGSDRRRGRRGGGNAGDARRRRRLGTLHCSAPEACRSARCARVGFRSAALSKPFPCARLASGSRAYTVSLSAIVLAVRVITVAVMNNVNLAKR